MSSILERRLPKYAAPLLLTAAALGFNACNQDEPKQPGPDIPPTPTMAGELPAEAEANTPSPDTKQTTTRVNHNGFDYELLSGITIDQLLETASLLSLRAPEVADTKIFVNAAKLKADQDPADPQITSDLLHAANILFAHSQICQDPQAGIREVAKGYAQDIASYLNEHDQTNWEAQKSKFLESPCYWGEEEQNTTTVVNHNGHDYELYTNVTIDDMIKTAELLPDFNINETVVNKLQGIKTSLQIDPTDPRVVPSLNQIINIADANCQDDIENSRELIRKVVSWVQENQPDYIEGTLKLATQGPCSVTGKAQVDVPPTPPDANSIELYTGVTLDQIINMASTLPESSFKQLAVKNIQSLKKVIQKDPQNFVYLFFMEDIANYSYTNCPTETVREINRMMASWLKQNRPSYFEQGYQLFTQGPCSLTDQTEGPAITRNEDVIPITNLNGHLTFRTNRYSYSLYPASETYSPDFKLYNGPALAFSFAKSQDVLGKAIPLTQEIDRLRQTNPNDPALVPLLKDFLDVFTPEVCNNNFAPGGYLKGIASIEYHMDPTSWPQKVDTYVNHPCFWGEKY